MIKVMVKAAALAVVAQGCAMAAAEDESGETVEHEQGELAVPGTNYSTAYGGTIASRADCDAIRQNPSTLTATQSAVLNAGCCSVSNRRRSFDSSNFTLRCNQAQFSVSCTGSKCPDGGALMADEATLAE